MLLTSATSTLQKREGYFNLAKVISVAAELHHLTPTLSFYISYTLEIQVFGSLQSNVSSYFRNMHVWNSGMFRVSLE